MKTFFVPETSRRLWAYFIDQVLVVILSFPLWSSSFAALIMGEEIFVSIPVFLLIIFFPGLYDFIFVALFGRTPGKWMMNMWIVPAADSQRPLHWTQALLRALCGRLSLFFSWAIFCLAFFRYDRTHLCDWVAETRVVQEKAPPRRFKLHPIVGSVLLVLYLIEGLAQAAQVLKRLDLAANRVEISAALGGSSAGGVEAEEDELE